ncbi:GH36-type glycosyl hydrolase domain-containing protein [Longimicrobium terrae]|uniref:Cyclic beta-1,2-glucan synthetase n=1 Tax=Longimicrobium terrae TaxID=1639882 RepID=A0A841GSR6_9BACT|nr:glycosyl transferase [Longimicrobium terrae]MBB4635055.1 cyclic beta-1,2-glucan synthetase [Longimicrobium terrae]MBB6069449.1 cyclic beta-1,2-glucan synthetase [Longimicrobium terrae]NNC31748.1 glycosyl transferase [Longimicrobium terrae]
MTDLSVTSTDSHPAAVLARGDYAVLLTPAGGGASGFAGYALTRWTADRTRDADGYFVYLRDVDSGEVWSAGYQPAGRAADEYHASPARGEIVRRDGGVQTTLHVCPAVEGDAELRRITLANLGDAPRRIEVTTYAELVLNTPAGDAGHPAFSKLFVQTGWMEDRQALVAWRRLRSPHDEPLWVVHRLLDDGFGAPEMETDRARFIGRGRTLAAPAAMDVESRLSGSVGNVLDPVFSLRRVVTVQPGGSVTLVAVLGAGRTRRDVEAIADRYPDAATASKAIDRSGDAGSADAAALGVPESWLRTVDSLPPIPERETPLPVIPRIPAPKPDGGAEPEELRFFNGFGGFSADGREYVIRHGAGEHGPVRPPLPWTNVIANEEAGFLVSESGAASTWTDNSRENRLTPWSNDPVSDPHGEALYLRDDASGRFWSPTPGPVPGGGAYETRHGFGYTRFRTSAGELEQETTLFVPRRDPVKIVRLRLTSTADTEMRISAFSYAQLVLGGLPQETRGSIHTRWDDSARAILAVNPDRGEFSARVAFAAVVSSRGDVSWTADRAAFLGPYGSPEAPLAPRTAGPLNSAAGAGLDPCAALQLSLVIPPGATLEVAFLLGEARDEAAARAIISRFRTPGAVGTALEEVTRFWSDLVGGVQVQTPSPELDLMVNGWLAYQNLACRVWGRTAFYQSGGAFGFRDQLQDSSALVYLRPELTRRQIILHASHQFVEGDVLHWWHPPLSKGIRTRFADDLLWLPYITAFYVSSTGDAGVLDESAPFVTARQLEPGEDEVFLFPDDSGQRASVYEHCCRSIDRSLARGVHGLPLMGTGDWNDGMNRVGREGRGESVWMGFFLAGILDDFAPVCEARGDADRAARYRAHRAELGVALNDGGWDGGWYRRAYYDNGAPLGSAANDECRIDAIAQAWAVLSGVAPADRAEQALDAMEQHLVSEEEGIIRLLTPAFDRTPHDPGYIKGYLPGVRENGGQYTHAALWAVRALAQAGRTERAARLLGMISPVSHGRTEAEVAVYQAEPYVIAADVYGVAPHVGRGGWTWYTGSAGWMFRIALESVLGITLSGGDTLVVRPCVPRDWLGFTVRYRVPGGAATYEIAVTREEGAGIRGTVKGRPLEPVDGALRIPLAREGGEHRVQVALGREFAPAYVPE